VIILWVIHKGTPRRGGIGKPRADKGKGRCKNQLLFADVLIDDPLFVALSGLSLAVFAYFSVVNPLQFCIVYAQFLPVYLLLIFVCQPYSSFSPLFLSL